MYTGLHVKYPLFLSVFNKDFLDIFSKNTPISDFMKICPVGADLLHANRQVDGRMDGWMEDGQTDITKLLVAFHNFANTLKRHKNLS